ncbi:O-antigen/teichoic acid export membrane protein [Sphingomonas insulae]|nr:lipopolysaccharide biosynthesis protein [Sphingomonas insulae]NIJ31118.1 O-antigen/teichoic acid export membrane protein [Sphingomonas insulae]
MNPAPNHSEPSAASLGNQVRRAILWRSGSQILAQMVQWAATFLVIRILDPKDYGLYAMTGVVLVFLNMLNGYGLASGLIQRDDVTRRQTRQLFGMLIAVNALLALGQIAIAPIAAAYYRQPEVAQLLRVQALIYVITPFAALPYALLSRAMEFRRQATANIAASLAGAAAALGGALAGWGVWTLVWAPIALYAVRAAILTWGARSLMWPSFDFRGAGHLARYGGIMAAGQFFWFLQSQVDVLIGGRSFDAHALGIYTTALFLAQIFVSKVVPPLNEVAFSAYARIQHDDDAVARAFVQSVRIIMLMAMPFYLGLAVTAEPLVLTALDAKWVEVAPVVRLIALAMPFMTVQVLYSPACDARGRPGVSAQNGAVGALLLGAAFLIGVRWGPIGLAWSWVAAYPLYLFASTWRALPVIGARRRDLALAIIPSGIAAVGMAIVVMMVDHALPPLAAPIRLAILVAAGAVTYGAWLAMFARGTVRELIAVIRKRPVPIAA